MNQYAIICPCCHYEHEATSKRDVDRLERQFTAYRRLHDLGLIAKAYKFKPRRSPPRKEIVERLTKSP